MKHTPEEIKYRLSDLGVQIGNIAIEYITELEKENEELKSGCGMCYRKDKEQLTKAKEALKSISELALELYVSDYSSKKLSERIQDKAEQFLKEIEE